MNPIEIIERFFEAWAQYDPEEILSYLAEDIEWTDVPLTTVNGIAAVREKLAAFSDIKAAAFEAHHTAANGNVVLSERTDWFDIGGKRRTIRVMGVFELNDDGKITRWRDYFDSAEFYREFGDLSDAG
ncbi:MAG: limonene-1,2-epoxide hydrolase family protein [Pseudomonadota bacterium]